MNDIEIEKDIAARVEKIQEAVRATGAEALLLTCVGNLLYVTGAVYNGYFYLPAEGEPINFIKKSGVRQFSNSAAIRKPEQIPELMAAFGAAVPKSMLFEDDQISYAEAIRLKAVFPDTEFLPASHFMREIRSVKTLYEIDHLREGAAKMVSVFERIPSVFKRGMTDIDLALEIEYLLMSAGHNGQLRTYGRYLECSGSSLLAGDNAIAPSPYDFALGGEGPAKALPFGANGTALLDGYTVLVDFGGNFNGYMVDMSRAFSIGKAPESAAAAHKTALDIQDMVIREAKPGAVCCDIYEKAVAIAKDSGFGEYFMGYTQQSRFVGHGVGIELNELPVIAQHSKSVIKEGMAIAVEPKFTLPGIGAVGVENTFIVRQNGLENLMPLGCDIVEL